MAMAMVQALIPTVYDAHRDDLEVWMATSQEQDFLDLLSRGSRRSMRKPGTIPGALCFSLTLLAAGLAAIAPASGNDPPPSPRPAESARAADPPQIQGVTVLERVPGGRRVIPLRGEVPAGWKPIASWLWSAQAAPRRLRPGELLPADLPPATRWLTVKLDPRAPCLRGTVRLVAAPREMYAEVPEGRLPWSTLEAPTERPRERQVRIPVPGAGPVRLRLACEGAGSWWQDVDPGAGEVTISPVAATDLAFTLSPPAGRAATLATVALFGDGRKPLARAAGATGERLTFPGLPAAHPVTLVARALGYPPRLVHGEIGSLPRSIRLEAGETIHGRLIDAERRPVAHASIQLEAWLEGSHGFLSRRRTTSDRQGRFAVKGLPPCRGALAIDAPGFARRVERVELGSGAGADLGTLTLVPARDLSVEVVEDDGAPLPGAEVETKDGHRATTDSEGRAKLTGLDPAAAQEVQVRHEGYLPATRNLGVPLQEEVRVALRKAFLVEGRLVSDGAPVEGGSAEWKIGNRFDSQALEEGRFRLTLEPGSEIELTLRSATTLPLVRRLDPGSAGEERDLGDVEAPRGESVEGVVVSAESGDPVPGAEVWMPRARPGGVAVALLLGDRAEAHTGADGSFRLTGVSPLGGQARVAAAGFAPRRVSVPPVANGEVGDLGTIEVSRGSTVVVTVEVPLDHPAQAFLDPTGEGVKLDVMTAPVVDGEARIEHVPAGRVVLSVLEGAEEICHRAVEIPKDGGESDVDCGARMTVTGVVTVGGSRAGAGTLRWMPGVQAHEPAAIFTRRSRLGVVDQQVWGPLSGEARVAVGGDGSFATEGLYPGRWSVFWNPEAGGQLGPVELDVPEVDRFGAELAFGGQVVRGWTVDPEGDPVPGARVRETAAGRVTFSGDDGGFTLQGLEPGSYELTARKDDLTSPMLEVTVAADRAPEPVTLVLARDDRDRGAVVRVVDAEGRPVPGAFVFLESARGIQLLTADADGSAKAVIDPPLPRSIRAAAYGDGRFALGDWVAWQDRTAGLSLSLGKEVGGLLIQSKRADGQVEVRGPGGWDLSRLSWLLGRPLFLEPGASLTLAGLPGGAYTVGMGPAPVAAVVEPGKSREVELP